VWQEEGFRFPATLFLGQLGLKKAGRMRMPGFKFHECCILLKEGQTFSGRMIHDQERKVSAGY
jgi:hypothetical protein